MLLIVMVCHLLLESEEEIGEEEDLEIKKESHVEEVLNEEGI